MYNLLAWNQPVATRSTLMLPCSSIFIPIMSPSNPHIEVYHIPMTSPWSARLFSDQTPLAPLILIPPKEATSDPSTLLRQSNLFFSAWQPLGSASSADLELKYIWKHPAVHPSFLFLCVHLRPRDKELKLAWQGAWHENTTLLRMRMLPNLLPVATWRQCPDWATATPLVNQPAGEGEGEGGTRE